MQLSEQLAQSAAGVHIIATDVDGVLTDGHGWLDAVGNELKQICYRDLDAIAVGRSMGLDFIIVTGESNEMVDVIAHRFSINAVLKGAKDKKQILMEECKRRALSPEQVCYIGDSDRDLSAIEWVGLGVAPKDGTPKARAAAKLITYSRGGDGVLAEVVELIKSIRFTAKF